MWLRDWFKKRNQAHPILERRLKILSISIFLQDRILLEPLGATIQLGTSFQQLAARGIQLSAAEPV